MSISFYAYVYDKSTQLYNIPTGFRILMSEYASPPLNATSEQYQAWMESDELNPHYNPDADVNFNDRNAKLVLNEMGLLASDMDPYNSDPISIGAFEAGLNATIARNTEAVPGIASYRSGRFVNFGVRDGYVNEALARLTKLLALAKLNNATHIGWG